MSQEETTTSYYTLVIQELPPSITAETLQPKLQKTTPDGNYIFQKSGHAMLKMYNKQTDGKLEDCLVALWTTPLTLYTQMDATSRHIINTIKTYINNNKIAISHHDGKTDTECQYHTIHLHIMVQQNKKNHICNNYDYKKLQIGLRPSATVISQKIRVPQAFAGHLTKQPKTFLGTNTPQIKLLIADAQQYQTTKTQLQLQESTKPDEQQPSTSRQQTSEKKPKMYKDIDTLLQLMKKYNAPDKIQLLRETTNSENQTDQQNMKDLIRLNNWNILYKKAQEEYDFLTH